MSELLTAAQMRAIEQAAIDSGEVTGLELMERAGRGVVEAIFEEWPEFKKTSYRAVVLCGPGNNGGDGFVVARLLKEWGWEVEVFLYGEVEKLPPDAKINCERWLVMGGISDMTDFNVKMSLINSKSATYDMIFIDAIFGTGLSRPLSGIILEYAEALAKMALGQRPLILSVDLPTGICSDSGRILRAAFPSDLCVTFHLPKVGHFVGGSPHVWDRIIIKEIGLPLRYPAPSKVTLACHDKGILSAWLDKTFSCGFSATRHKFHHGHALILSGPATKTGAARLAARGALRIGAGLVTIGSPSDALAEHAAQLNALMLKGIDDAVTLGEVLKDERITSLCLGPSMGLTDTTKQMVEVALTSQKKCVLDADALTVFQDNPQELFDMLHENVVLTPHGGEFARLFTDISEHLNEIPTIGPAYSKVDATRDAATRAGCVVLYKGADTVIADAFGRAVINSAHYERQVPWLATAGSGDVLAGFITGLMARGIPPMTAAEMAAWLHVECGLNFGAGLIAEDLPEQLPTVLSRLLGP